MKPLKRVELKEFVQAAIEQIEAAAGERWIKDAIEFEVSVSETREQDGALKIYVASGQSGMTTECSQRIRFQVTAKPPKARVTNTQNVSESEPDAETLTAPPY